MAKQARKVGGLGSLGGYDPVLTPLGGEELLMLAAANAGPQMRGYEPSLREQIGNVIYDAAGGLGGLGGIRNRIRDEAMIGLDFIPGLGEALGGEEAGRAFGSGDYLGGGLGLAASALGVVPVVGDAAAAGMKKGIRAFHGSPHDFDRFDMSKIGTGEGAQAYGHGLYFAENEDVARGYRDTLSRRNDEVTWDGKPLSTSKDYYAVADALESEDWRLGKVFDHFVKEPGTSEERLRRVRDWYRDQPEMMAAVNRLESRVSATPNPGSMYEVRINADPEEFLDWDKPLSEQGDKINELVGSRLEQFLDMAGPQIQRPYDRFIAGETTGEEAYKLMHPQAGVDQVDWSRGLAEQASQRLRDAGFAGIKYRDAGSRTVLPDAALTERLADYDRQIANARREMEKLPEAYRGEYQGAIDQLTRERAAVARKAEPTRNYVVFDDSLIEIVRKYGIPAAIGAGLISEEMGRQMQEQGLL